MLIGCLSLIALIISSHRKTHSLPIKDRPVAVIDAGHGAFTSSGVIDVGTNHYGLNESEIVLDIALRAQRQLEVKGWVAITTRDGKWTPFTLFHRSNLASLVQADVLVSLHLNSHRSRRANGIEVFYWQPKDKLLAELIQNRLSERLGLRNKGAKTAPFAVLVNSSVPTVLIELAFLSNRREAQRLSNPEFREKAAKALAEVLEEWYRQK
ncbi:MAG: N-acetylmuramoyl-L-alanine amidase family protein [Candidatus Fervidibacter sp.]|uniref:N-acetylmuramoyl-L-alanine amidase family protein n=1 Tax=Candidatus Fervidibacter sp. TaxID=3100871 RepID=UPI0040497072